MSSEILNLQIPETVDNPINLLSEVNEVTRAIDKVQQFELAKRLLCTSAYLISVTVRLWRGQMAVASNAVTDVLSNKAIELYHDDKLASPKWNFLPKKWRKKFSNIENKIRTIVNSLAISTPVRGVYIVSKESCAVLVSELENIDNELFKPTVQSFFEDIDNILESVEQELAKNKIEATHLENIDINKISEHFKLEKYVIPLSTRSDVLFMNNEQTEKTVEMINKLVDNFVDETTLYIYDALLHGLVVEYNKLAAKFSDKENIKNIKLRSNSLNSLKSVISKFNGFKFMFVHYPNITESIDELTKAVNLFDPSSVKEQIREGNWSFIDGLLEITQNCIKNLEEAKRKI